MLAVPPVMASEVGECHHAVRRRRAEYQRTAKGTKTFATQDELTAERRGAKSVTVSGAPIAAKPRTRSTALRNCCDDLAENVPMVCSTPGELVRVRPKLGDGGATRSEGRVVPPFAVT